MRSLVGLAISVALLACGSAPPAGDRSEPRQAADSVMAESLMAYAATDFGTQRAPRPARFRDVRSGFLTTAEGTRQYRLCGEFSREAEDGKEPWIPFATIKTSPYEQWLGGQARGFCDDASMTWHDEDLSERLLSRVESLP